MPGARVEICGGIGVGKTTLASRLSEVSGMALALESYRDVPFWEKYATSAELYEFEKNASFILSHADRIRTASINDTGLVCDFALVQDLAYVELSRCEEDIPVLRQFFAHANRRQRPPDILIYLRCTPETQLQRIRRRGREIELSIDASYLARFAVSIDRQVEKPEYRGRILEIDTNVVNFVEDQRAIAAIWKELQAMLANRLERP